MYQASRFISRQGHRFCSLLPCLKLRAIQLVLGARSLRPSVSDMKLTNHYHLLPMLRMHGDVPPFPHSMVFNKHKDN